MIELTGVQGLIRAMEEYGIPIDHIAGGPVAPSEVIKWLTIIHKARVLEHSLAGCMLVREISLQAPGELNSSVDEWVTFGGFSLMSHILLLLIQRCVTFRIQLKASMTYRLYKGA